MKLLVMIWCGILLGALMVHGQNVPTEPSAHVPHFTFDVVSIREFGGGNMRYVRNLPHTSLYAGEGVTLRGLIMGAYDIQQNFQLTGEMPSWVSTHFYSITAKADPSVDEVLVKLSVDDAYVEKDHMLQGMLADRFKLKIHAETRESDVYELVRTKQAEKLMTPIVDPDPKTEMTCYPSKRSSQGAEIEAKGCSFRSVLSLLRTELGTAVVDHTGMTGKFAFDLKWCPDSLAMKNDEEHYPRLADAVREQLGLELKRTKGPVTFWVVDHIEAPSAN